MNFDRATAKRGKRMIEKQSEGQPFRPNVEMARDIARARQGNAKKRRKGAKGVLSGVLEGKD